MMKEIKKYICWVAAIILVLSMTSCGNTGSSGGDETTAPPTETTGNVVPSDPAGVETTEPMTETTAETTEATADIEDTTPSHAETTAPSVEQTDPSNGAGETEPGKQDDPAEVTTEPSESKPTDPAKPAEETKPAGGNGGGSGTVDPASCKHKFDDGVYTAPTCEEAGKLVSTCKICGLQRVSDYMATGHSYTAKIVAPTVEAQGYTLHTCSRCGNTYKDNYTDKLPAATTPAHSHSYAGVVTQEATCTKTGTKTYTCSCGDSYTEEIPVGDHTWKCIHHEAEGHYSDYYVVCRCGWSMKKSEMEATGYNFIQYYALFHVKGEREHSYTLDGTDWVEDTPAYDEWVCTECGKTTTENPS